MEACKYTKEKNREIENQQYAVNQMQREEILERLRKNGCRITKQRRILIDVILESECSCCKEIYYLAAQKMPEIGIATIYRMLNSLEEVGAIQRKAIYCVCDHQKKEVENFVVELENGECVNLENDMLAQIIEKGMRMCGYSDTTKVKKVRNR